MKWDDGERAADHSIMWKLINNNKGMALVLTILIISLVVSLTLQLNAAMRDHLVGAANVRDGIRLNYVAKSGFNYGLAVLQADAREDSKEGDRGDSLLEAWANQEIFQEGAGAMFANSRFQVKISDESGRIQINSLINEEGEINQAQRGLLIRFLESPEFDLDSDTAKDIVAAIIDWIDDNDETTAFESGGVGAETKDYLRRDPPYPCHNAPVEFLEELLLVNGITKELYFGTPDKPGIADYISSHGDGKININTADPLVLKALSEDMTDWMVDSMVEYRQDENNNLKELNLSERMGGSVEVNADLLTTESSFFQIVSQGFQGEMAKQITGMVKRSEEQISVLSLKIE